MYEDNALLSCCTHAFLRAKFDKENQPEKLKILDDINAYVEDLEKYYSSA